MDGVGDTPQTVMTTRAPAVLKMENVGGIYVLCLRCHFDQEFRQAQKPTDEGIQVKLARYHVKTFDIEMLQK